MKEDQNRLMELPEPAQIITLILDYLYGRLRDDIIREITGKMSFDDLLLLYGTSDKYSISPVKSAAFQAWTSRFDRLMPDVLSLGRSELSIRDFSTFENVLSGLQSRRSDKEMPIDAGQFDEHVEKKFGDGMFMWSVETRRAIFALKPTLVRSLVRKHCLAADAPSNVYRAFCPCCHNEWVWSRLGHEAMFACPFCKAEREWEDYSVHWLIERGQRLGALHLSRPHSHPDNVVLRTAQTEAKSS